MDHLLGKTNNELKEVVESLGLPIYTAAQIAKWLYQSPINSFDEMSNISLKNREILKSSYEFGPTLS